MEMFTCRSSSLELFDIIDVLSRGQVEILEILLPVFSVVTYEILKYDKYESKVANIKFELNIFMFMSHLNL